MDTSPRRQPTLAETFVLLNPESADGTRALCLLLVDWVAQGWLELKPTRILHRPGEIWSGESVRGVDVATLSPRLDSYARRYSAPRLVMEGVRSAGPLGQPFTLRSAAFYWRERLGRDHRGIVSDGLLPDLRDAGYLDEGRTRRFLRFTEETVWRHTEAAGPLLSRWRDAAEAARLTLQDVTRDPEDLHSIAAVARLAGATLLFLPDVTPRDCRIAAKALRSRGTPGGDGSVLLRLDAWERYGKRLERAVTNVGDGATTLSHGGYFRG